MSPGRGAIIGIGELLWDLLPDGPRLGGAPFNVAANAHRLGYRASIVTAVGRDDLGSQARAIVRDLGVDDDWIQETPDLPTGTARVALDADGNPTFELVRPAAFDRLSLDDQGVAAIAAAAPAALVFGTLAQQSHSVRAATEALAAACPASLRVYDVNLREGSWDVETVEAMLRLASIVKVNDTEATILGEIFGMPDRPLAAFMSALLGRTGGRGVCVTRGPDGAGLLIDDIGVQGHAPTIEVVDAVGAGDAFTAGLIHGVLTGQPPDVALRGAIALGSLVASRAGGAPNWTAAELAQLEAATPAAIPDWA
jgi:fructokinase